MSNEAETQGSQRAGHDLHSIYDVLHALVGRDVTIVNTHALVGGPTGKLAIDHAVYAGKIRAVTEELLVVFTDFDAKGRGEHPEPAKEFIPIHHVNRVSVIKGQTNIHI